MKWLLVLCIFLLTSSVVTAQDSVLSDDQLENLNLIRDAFQRLEQLDSFRIHSETNINEQVDTKIGGGVNPNIIFLGAVDSDYDVVRRENGHDIAGINQQQSIYTRDGETTTTTSSYEVVALGEQIYVRGTNHSAFPETWTDVSRAGAIEKYPNLANLDQERLERIYSFYQTFEESTFQSIEEVDHATIHEQTMRVFELVYATEALPTTNSLNLVAGILGLSEKYIDNLEEMYSDARLTLTIYIGLDNGVVTQAESQFYVDSQVSIRGRSFPFNLETIITRVFSDFNEPMTIEAPDLSA